MAPAAPPRAAAAAAQQRPPAPRWSPLALSLALGLVQRAGAALPWFDEDLGDSLWAEAKKEAASLSHAGSEQFVCGAGNWGDGPQCNEWDQGRSPCWPSAMTVSATWDTDIMARWARELGQEFGDRGMLGPGVNLARFAWNGRLGEYMSGEDPVFGARMVSAMVTATRELPKPPIQVVKHYIPNTIENSRDSITEVVDERTLFEVYYPAFAAAVDAGISSVMCSYNLVKCTSGVCSGEEAYACASDDVLNKHLKDIMGFRGIVMSDWDATNCKSASATGCKKGSYIDNDVAADSGLDLEMPSCQTFSGGVTKKAREKAARMLWAYKVQGRSFQARRLEAVPEEDTLAAGLGGNVTLGSRPRGRRERRLAEPVYVSSNGVYQDNPFSKMNSPAPAASAGDDEDLPEDLCPDKGGDNYKSACKLDFADRIIVEAATVLKNEGGILPLKKSMKVALIGTEACAKDPLAQGGGSGWNGFSCNEVPKVSVGEGIKGLHGAKKPSCPDSDGENDEAESADVVVAVVVPEKASEGSDRPSLQLESKDKELILKYSKMGKKVVVAMNAPGPMITSTWDKGVAGLIVTWLPGQQNGRGIAMALYAEKYSASGRLPFTFPKCSTPECTQADERASVPLGDQIDSGEYTTYAEKALIGYRWYHAKKAAVSYPFGFGLFAYGTAVAKYEKASAKVRGKGEGAEVSCKLAYACKGSKSSCLTGKEVPQLYLKFPASVPGDANQKPEWVLKGFSKVDLGPSGASVTFKLSQRDLSYWDDSPGSSKWVCAKGVFTACVGPDAQSAVREGGACTKFAAICGPDVKPRRERPPSRPKSRPGSRHPLVGAAVAGAFAKLAGMDCLSRQNAYGAKVSDPAVCQSECLNDHRDCVAVVVWQGKCYFRNMPHCIHHLHKAVDSTTYILKERMSAAGTAKLAKLLGAPEKEQEDEEEKEAGGAVRLVPAAPTLQPVPEGSFSLFEGKDCFPGQNAYKEAGDAKTCRAECLYTYKDCAAVIVVGDACYFRDDGRCLERLEATDPDHKAYVLKERASSGAGSRSDSGKGRSAGTAAPEASSLHVPDGFVEMKGKDCLPGRNAYKGRIGEPKSCLSECLHKFKDCVGVVIVWEQCYFRNDPSCEEEAETASEHHVLYVVSRRSGEAAAGAGAGGATTTGLGTTEGRITTANDEEEEAGDSTSSTAEPQESTSSSSSSSQGSAGMTPGFCCDAVVMDGIHCACNSRSRAQAECQESEAACNMCGAHWCTADHEVEEEVMRHFSIGTDRLAVTEEPRSRPWADATALLCAAASSVAAVMAVGITCAAVRVGRRPGGVGHYAELPAVLEGAARAEAA